MGNVLGKPACAFTRSYVAGVFLGSLFERFKEGFVYVTRNGISMKIKINFQQKTLQDARFELAHRS